MKKTWIKCIFSGTTGIAYTNGLTKLDKGAVPTGDKKIQFGSKILHRGALELGWNFYGKDTRTTRTIIGDRYLLRHQSFWFTINQYFLIQLSFLLIKL